MFHVLLSDSESLQSAQTSVEGEVHSKPVCGQFKHPGGGALVQRWTKIWGVFGNVSKHAECVSARQCHGFPAKPLNTGNTQVSLQWVVCVCVSSYYLTALYLCVSACVQVWSWLVQDPCQSEAAVHTHPDPGGGVLGLPAYGEHMQRRLHLRPLRRTAQRASWTTEQAGTICQYQNCCVCAIWTVQLHHWQLKLLVIGWANFTIKPLVSGSLRKLWKWTFR